MTIRGAPDTDRVSPLPRWTERVGPRGSQMSQDCGSLATRLGVCLGWATPFPLPLPNHDRAPVLTVRASPVSFLGGVGVQ